MNRLTIRGEKQTNAEEKTGEVLYQGIAARIFERSFQLADYVKVKGASLENGLLHVELVRDVPEAMKPRSIPIGATSKRPSCPRFQGSEACPDQLFNRAKISHVSLSIAP